MTSALVMKLTVRRNSHWMNVKMVGKLSTNQEASLVFAEVASWGPGDLALIMNFNILVTFVSHE